jgi:lipoprotein-anchoring transpeptidase ErfK/SrfK
VAEALVGVEFGTPWQPAVTGGRPAWRRWVWAVVLVVALTVATWLAALAYGTWAYAQGLAGRLLPGAVVAGIDVGGLTPHEALATVRAVTEAPLDRQVVLRFQDRTWTTTPRALGSASDAEEAIADAVTFSAAATWSDLARLRWFGEPVTFRRDVSLTHDPTAARAWVDSLAAAVNRAPSDAALDTSTGWVRVVPEQLGYVVNTEATATALAEAVEGGATEVALGVDGVPAAVTTAAFDQVLLLRQDEHKLYLYQDGAMTHSWTVATGTAGYPTPTGIHNVTLKRYLPTWVNPSPNGWGRSLPARIGPGRGNPLGLRALNWSAPNIRFHGTQEVSSLGRDASHGCVRMSNPDVIELFDLVREGATIVSLK